MQSVEYYIYIDEIVNNTKSVEPRTNKGISDFIWLYTIHKEEDIIFIIENIKEYGFVDLLVYNRNIKMNLPNIEILIAKYAITNSYIIKII